MNRYIDADMLEKNGWNIQRIRQVSATEMVYETKKPTDFPTADVQKVQRGRWVNEKCSECGCEPIKRVFYRGELIYEQGYIFNYCPNCGAKMDNEEEKNETD